MYSLLFPLCDFLCYHSALKLYGRVLHYFCHYVCFLVFSLLLEIPGLLLGTGGRISSHQKTQLETVKNFLTAIPAQMYIKGVSCLKQCNSRDELALGLPPEGKQAAVRPEGAAAREVTALTGEVAALIERR
jgi:hypothetical protein